MDKLLDNLAKNLASNLLNLRAQSGLSQLQLSQRAEIPRSTLTYMESGESNPSLANLAKISNALQVSIEELISQPYKKIQLIKSEKIPLEKKSKSKVLVEKLLPDSIPGMEIDKINLEPRSRMKGTPHISQTKEYLYCSTGSIHVYVNKTRYNLNTGDLLSFPGDEPHAYENTSATKKASCFSVVVFAPRGL